MRLRLTIRLILLLFSFLLVNLTLQANANPLYHIKNIEEKITSSDTEPAKKKAQAQAELKAFRKLLTRLTLQKDHDAIDLLFNENKDTINPSSFIQSYEVTNEKIRATSYQATFSFIFSPELVQNFLASHQIPYSDQIAPSILLIPTLEEEQASNDLWQNSSPWDRTWQNLTPDEALPLQIQFAAGDLEDIALLSLNDLLSNNRDAITTFLKRYKTNDLILLHLSFLNKATPNKPVRWRVLQTNYTKKGEGDTQINEGYILEFDATAYQKIRDQILFDLIEAWKKTTLINNADEQKTHLLFDLPHSLKTLIKIKTTLNKFSFVKNYQIEQLNKNEAILIISYIGSAENLKRSLKNNHLTFKIYSSIHE